MSKPSKMRCKKYCDIYPCKRTNCNRKLVLWSFKESSMEEPSVYKPIDYQMKKLRYGESRATKINN